MLTQAEICIVSSKLKSHFLKKTYLENYLERPQQSNKRYVKITVQWEPQCSLNCSLF